MNEISKLRWLTTPRNILLDKQKNYMHLIMIDSMRHKKYTSQIGEKISNFGNHDFQKFISVNTCINKHLGRI